MGNARHVHGPVTTAKDGRFADGGLLAVQGPTVIDARTGVLAGPGSTVLVTGTSATAPMTVAIAPHHWVTTRGSANGPYLGALEAATTVTIPAAPAAGTGTRIDVVYSKQQDAQPGIPTPDGTTAPLYGVVSGVAGGAKPALPVGAEELATVAVAPGATATNGANVTITNTARQTVARGADIPVRTQAERDALTTLPLQTAKRLDTGRIERRNAADTAWDYAGGAPPPIALLSLASGWTAFAGHAPGVYKTSDGLVKLVGAALNATLYNPQDGTTRTILTLPSGYRPAASFVVGVSTASVGNASGPIVSLQFNTDGTVNVVGGTSSQVIQQAAHWFEGVPAFHPGYSGGALV